MSDQTNFNEEDLIIIPDNSVDNEKTLSFWSDENNSEIKEEEVILSDKTESLEDNDLFSLSEESVKTDKIESKTEEQNIDNSVFDFGSNITEEKKVEIDNNIKIEEPIFQTESPIIDNIETKVEEKTNILEWISNEQTNSEEDLNSIITWTIAKLEWRKTKIWWKKDNNITKIEELKNKISELEKEKLNYEGQNSELDEESDKISKDIIALEKMKLSDEEDKTEKKIEKKKQ